MSHDRAGPTIVHVLATVQHGGAERVVLELARAQRSGGADAEVLCLQQLGALEPAFRADGIPIALAGGGGRPGALRVAWRLAAELRRRAPEVIHTHNSAPQITAGLGRRLGRWSLPGSALVHTEHGRLGDVGAAVLRYRRWTVAAFDAVIAVSADARAQMLAHGIRAPRGVDVVENGIDLSRYPARTPAIGSATIVQVGRLDRIKGQDVLLDALPAVRRAVPAARLLLVGDGPARATLTAQAERLGIADAVEFVGAVDDVRPFLARAELFVLPSRSEGISLALLEAMATALPVVATDVGGNREVIDSPAVGILVAVDDAGALASGIARLLGDPAGAGAMGRAARAAIAQRFSSTRTVDSYAAIYQRALADAAHRTSRSAA